MTTQKWVKKQLDFAIENINTLEELKIHLQMILTRLQLSPLEKESKIKMYLCNYADGAEGHFCIGRSVYESNYWEYYNKGKWCSAGEVFIGKTLAEKY